MTPERFLQFSQTLDALQKAVQKLKFTYAPVVGIKGMHLFWICELKKHPEGLSLSELARCAGVDRALVSREITELVRRGYVETPASDGKRSYKTPLRLTERGQAAAEQIGGEAVSVQTLADEGITDAELETFYAVSQKLTENLCAVIRSWEDRFSENQESVEEN